MTSSTTPPLAYHSSSVQAGWAWTPALYRVLVSSMWIIHFLSTPPFIHKMWTICRFFLTLPLENYVFRPCMHELCILDCVDVGQTIVNIKKHNVFLDTF